MARPISKYFTPVIRKIIEAKKMENIVVDDRFKAVLRKEVMARAAGMAGRAGSRSGFDKERIYDGAAEFFRKWKYQLALAPVAFLMVLAAAQTFKMPVEIKSETVVPQGETVVPAGKEAVMSETAVPASRETVPGENAAMESETNMPEKPATAVQESFEGHTPVIKFEEAAFESVPYLPAPVPAYETTLYEKEVAVPAQTVIPQTQPQSLPGKEVIVPVPDASFQEQPVSAHEQPVITERAIAPQTVILQPEKSEKKPGTAAGDVPPELLSPERAVLTETAESGSSASDAGTGQPVSDAIQNITDERAATLRTGTTRTVEGVKLVEVSMPPEPEIVLPIYYDPVFEERLKQEFEKEVLADLIDGEEYTFASITKGSDGVVNVELYLKDGSVLKKYYLKNVGDGVWNEVRYVQSYFFDDSFEYVRSERSYPGIFNPYQYPHLNR